MRAIAAIITSGAVTGWPERGAYDVAVGERRGLREGEDPIGKTVAPGGQALRQSARLSGRGEFPDTEGDLGNCHRR